MPPPALLVLLGVFLSSNILFLLRAVAEPWAAICLSALLAGSVVALYQSAKTSPLGWRWGLGALALALALCVIGGGGHVMSTTEDWQVRDAVLHDLMRPEWPVVYGSGAARQVLRAPVGFYVLPAAAGRLWGLAAGHFAVLAQNTAIVTAVLLLWAREFASTRSRLIGVAAVTLFSGWDIVGEGVLFIGTHLHHTPFNSDGLHIEPWSGLEYSSFLTDLFWAPNHGLPALAFAGLYFAWRRSEVSAPALALFGGLSLLWSPLAVMGMTPFVVYALVSEFRAGLLSLRGLALGAVAGAAVLPILIYLQLDSHAVVHGFLLGDREFWGEYPLLLVFEIVPILYLLLRPGFGETGAKPAELVVIAAALLLIPVYKIGPSDDFLMRASIAPLALAAVFAARRLADNMQAGRVTAVRIMGVVLAIGAVTPMLQVVRAFVRPPSAPVTLPLPQAWAASVYGFHPIDTYLASPASLARYHALLKSAPEPQPSLARAP